MEPEVTESTGNKKKFLVITLVVILAVVGVALWFLFLQKVTPVRGPETLVIKEILREPTEAEKLLKSQIDELDKARGQVQSQSTTTLQDQIKTLDSLRNKTVSKVAPKTIEQQMAELDAIR